MCVYVCIVCVCVNGWGACSNDIKGRLNNIGRKQKQEHETSSIAHNPFAFVDADAIGIIERVGTQIGVVIEKFQALERVMDRIQVRRAAEAADWKEFSGIMGDFSRTRGEHVAGEPALSCPCPCPCPCPCRTPPMLRAPGCRPPRRGCIRCRRRLHMRAQPCPANQVCASAQVKRRATMVPWRMAHGTWLPPQHLVRGAWCVVLTWRRAWLPWRRPPSRDLDVGNDPVLVRAGGAEDEDAG